MGGGSTTTTTTSSSSGPAVCGDGIIQGKEECDDENSLSGDGCADCVVECGGEGEARSPAFHCYKFQGSELFNSTDAKSTCAKWRENGTLVTVTSKDELDFLISENTTEPGTWIGATDVNSSGKFQWGTGEAWTLDFWAEGYPKDIGQSAHCAAFTSSDLKWQNTPCQDGKHVICESSPVGEPAP